MIDCAIGTYIDNQQHVHYPVGYVSRQWQNFTKLFWFTSDAENAGLLEKEREAHPLADRIQIEIISRWIKEPADLMRVYPDCVERLQASGCQFVAFQEADLVLTDLGTHTIIEQIAERRVMGIPAMQSKVYCELYDNPHGCVVFAAESDYRIGPNTDWEVHVDGAPWTAWDLKHPQGGRLMLDLGYLSTTAYYTKMVNHGRIWKSPDSGRRQAAFNRSKAEGVRDALAGCKSECGRIQPIDAADPQYAVFLNDLDLWADYRFVMGVLHENNR